MALIQKIDRSGVEPRTDGARAFLKRADKSMLIGGEWTNGRSARRLESIDPATGQHLATFPQATVGDVNDAVAAARACHEAGAWCSVVPARRAEIMWKIAELLDLHIDELAELETLDQGKPLAVGRWAEIPGAAAQFRYFAGMATKIEGRTITPSIDYQPEGKRVHAYTTKEPVGVVAAITPWNSPLIMYAMKLAPALAAGCSVILKPAEETSLTAIRLGELIVEAGVPAGAVNIVTGLGEEVGAALARHPDVDKVAFTGSTETGRAILDAAKGNLKKVTLELGGKSPVILLNDANLDLAVAGAANAIFFNAGQVCVAGSRLYAQDAIYDYVLDRLAEIGGRMVLGHGLKPETEMGPLVSAQHATRVAAMIKSGLEEGASLRTGGDTFGPLETFISPTLLADVGPDMKVVREEIFGPVLTCASFQDVDEVIDLANASSYGLAASVWTESLSAAHLITSQLRTGTVWINSHLMFDPSLPIGGYKQSGWGRESGQMAVENYLETKTVCAVV